MRTRCVARHGAALLFGLFLLQLGACMDSPRDGDPLINKYSKVVFRGFSLHPNDSIQVWVKNQRTGSWVKRGTPITSSSTATPDATGRKFYQFERENVSLPTHDDYWRKSGSMMQVEVKTSSSKQGGDLASFKVDAEDTCAVQQLDGVAIALQCSSARSPAARLQFGCGRKLMACCQGFNVSDSAQCEDFTTCKSGQCQACGGEGQQPCDDGPECGNLMDVTPSGVCSRCSCQRSCAQGRSTGWITCDCATPSASYSVETECN